MASITGTNGSDVIDEHDGVTNGDDSIWGRGGDDLMFGLGGDDFFYGDAGADTMYGGSGIDRVDYWNFSTEGVWVDLASGTGSRGLAQGDRYFSVENVGGTKFADVITGNDGDNTLRGYDGDDVLKGGGGADDLIGDSGNDVIKGGGGDDILEGGLGTDTLIGGAGDDEYFAHVEDTVSESAGEGYDWVQALAYAYTLPDNVEGLVLYSRGGVYGTGNVLANTIWGNDIDNVLNGAGGADMLIGLGGNDTFVFRRGEAHGDTVYDFQGNGAGVGDVLQFSGYGTVAQGATFRQLTATVWEIGSADGLTQDLITLAGAATIDFSDLVFV